MEPYTEFILFVYLMQQLGRAEPAEDILSSYEELNGVPKSLLQNAIFATNEEEAQRMANAFITECHGYANNKDMPSQESKTFQVIFYHRLFKRQC